MTYQQFIQSKQAKTVQVGFEPEDLNRHLFPFQKEIVQRACRRGKYAIFADCGLGKTLMQLEWARQVATHTGGKVLILCPLAVAGQTISEGEKFGVYLTRWQEGNADIFITNYESFHKVDLEGVAGVVLDESSILKNYTGKMKRLVMSRCEDIPYKLACTATPAPNDLNEIGNHSEFLDVMDAPDMRMRWFVRDEGMNNYRLKGHAFADFYGWIGSWSSVLRKPSDIGYQDEGYDLPPLHFHDREIETEQREHGMLFNEVAVSATNFNAELRLTKVPRMEAAAEIVNASDEPFIVWVRQNEEAKFILDLIPDAVEVHGGMTPEQKESAFLAFKGGKFRVLVTKTKIAQFGLNFQHCPNQIFASLDFSFEGLYQAIRRSYRFGQNKEVNIYIISTDTMENVTQSINRKQKQFNEMMAGIVTHANETEYTMKAHYEKVETKTDDYHLVNADCVDAIQYLEDDSVDLSVFSPPFSTLFTYSDNIRDMGNCVSNEEFFEQTMYLLRDLYRVMKPGRLVCVHSKDLARYKNSSGYTGLYDFTGDYHRAMEEVGFKYHSKVTIWTDPVLEMQRTKTQRLLYKQLRKDSSYTGIGLPEYVTIFKKWEGAEEDWEPITNKTRENFPLDTWQKWASPVWMDIQRTDVLNDWRGAKDAKDEKHICPLQLGVIERCIGLWSNPGELVFTPFAGIGSEVYQAVKMHRRGLGFELKPSYYEMAKKNCAAVLKERDQIALF
jgi:DNA modification methylase